ncbi:MAG: hypothetical protein WHT46_06900 [Candidatus Geothermincolales bacterium]
MKELVDILSTYLALGAGLATFWWGLFRNWSLDDCLTRTLLAMAVVFLVGQVARFLMAVALFLGGKFSPTGSDTKRAREESAEEVEGG